MGLLTSHVSGVTALLSELNRRPIRGRLMSGHCVVARDALSSRQTAVYEKPGRHLPVANSSETGERVPELVLMSKLPSS